MLVQPGSMTLQSASAPKRSNRNAVRLPDASNLRSVRGKIAAVLRRLMKEISDFSGRRLRHARRQIGRRDSLHQISPGNAPACGAMTAQAASTLPKAPPALFIQ
jgi:hypothetical protein